MSCVSPKMPVVGLAVLRGPSYYLKRALCPPTMTLYLSIKAPCLPEVGQNVGLRWNSVVLGGHFVLVWEGHLHALECPVWDKKALYWPEWVLCWPEKSLCGSRKPCYDPERALFKSKKPLFRFKRALRRPERVLCFSERALCRHESDLCQPERIPY